LGCCRTNDSFARLLEHRLDSSLRWKSSRFPARDVSDDRSVVASHLALTMTTRPAIPKEAVARLRAYLALKGLTQLDLAKRLGHPVSTLSSWLRGVAPAPHDLVSRIERALKLPSGALALGNGLDTTSPKPE
jgi:hypothetical protein